MYALEVVCVHIPPGNYKNSGPHGQIYTVDYVNKLYAMVERNLTVPHRFNVITTDIHQRYHSGINVIKEKQHWLWHWMQLEIYNKELFSKDQQCLYLDQDCIIIGNHRFLCPTL